eukprot:TRINITY_DN19042_c0_g1_i1.p1 TRINITY_DN19042_c0_g1~~TRINITY_DN19042_c0_g1_i1.p1  ORF type:complete len:298 (+),score=89.54 TRINITY_DN19042_c0_g1_i1:84-977(+)
MVKNSNMLFSPDTVVIHISGSKESAGKILKTNDGLFRVFGYNKSEVINHLVNLLMPSLFAKRHAEFLEKFFQTGRKPMFNQQSVLYAVDREGCCFQVKIVLKQLPDLSEGLQYVGMIRQSQKDCEYIITDMNGVIDSFSKGVKEGLRIAPSIFKDNKINVQVLAPDLIKVFSSIDKKRTLLEKFKEPGGQKITFYVPKDFAENAKSNERKKAKDPRSPRAAKGVKNKDKGSEILYKQFNKDINKHGGVASSPMSPQKLLKSLEYRECAEKHNVRLSLIHICRCRRIERCRSRWSPYH